MSLATETDAREAIRLILDDNSTNADYSNAGSKPGTIEVVEASPRREKKTIRADALYIWKPADTAIERFGAGASQRRERPVVQVEAFASSASQAHALREDIISITGAYANDSQASTAFVDVFPISETDARHEAATWAGENYVEVVQVRLRRLDAV